MVRAVVCLVAVAWGTFLPRGLPAQELDLIPMVGAYEGLNDLGTVRGTGEETLELGKIQRSLAFGAGLQVGLGASVALRGSALFTEKSEVPVTGPCDCRPEGSLVVLSGALILRPSSGALFVRPYLLLGGGMKRHDVEEEAIHDAGFPTFRGDQERGTARLGVGLELDLGVLEALVELSDHVSTFRPSGDDDELQNDVFLIAGLRF